MTAANPTTAVTFGAGISRTPLPGGFLAAGINCGVRRYRPDVGLITSQVPATAAAVFTQNTCLGAHIPYCQDLLPSTQIQALITNSGQANTAMGPQGVADNLAMASAVAASLNLQTSQVLTASTGVIGEKLQVDKITAAVDTLVADRVDTAENFATAILTTDLVPKTVSATVPLEGGEIQLTGIAKGSGMIHPNMATMLGYFLTDLTLAPGVAQTLLQQAVAPTFNMISVDGEPSTNDSVFLLANGHSGVHLQSDRDHQSFLQALIELGQALAKSIARDGEGATKLLEVVIQGAPDPSDAVNWARSLTVSPLIKTAVHGKDPNWGRILARLGAAGVPTQAFDQLTVAIQGLEVFSAGAPTAVNPEEVRQQLHKDEVQIVVDLHWGAAQATAWGCDLSRKYVEINAEYTT